MAKKITIALVIIIILALALGGFWFYQNRNTQEGTRISFKDFLPFGQSPEPEDFFVPEPTPEETSPPTDEELPQLRKISENPVAGAFIYNENNEIFIKYTDQATGHTFLANTGNPTLQRITNTTIPKISEALWTGSNSVILRYLKDDNEIIETVALKFIPPAEITHFEFKKDLTQGATGVDVLELQKTLNKDPETQVALTGPGSPGKETSLFGPATKEAVKKFQSKFNLTEPTGNVDSLTRDKLNEITGAKKESLDEEEENLYETVLTYLPADIKNIAYIETLQKIFYLQEDSLGTVGTLADRQNGGSNQIFESVAREWLPQNGGNKIILQTKPAYNFAGLAFSLSSAGSLEKILDDITGLTIQVSPLDNTRVAFSESTGKTFSLSFYKKDQNKITVSEKTTLPEKCVWSKVEAATLYCAIPRTIPQNNYPDSWYQGEVSFTDDIWEIDSATGIGTMIETLPLPIDAVSFSLSPKDEYLLFTNKKDHSLWSLKLVD